MFSGCRDSGPKYNFNTQPRAINRSAGETVVLFDGSDFNHWQMGEPGGWEIDDGSMLCNAKGYLWSTEHFGDFILECEFKMSPDCNSGIFIRTGNPNDPVQTGMEIQIIDTFGKPDPDKHDSGAFYDLMEPSENAVKQPGEWNQMTITCNKNMITVVLNNVPVIEANVDNWFETHKNPDGTDNKFSMPIKDFPRTGFIGFQDHGHPVWFRDIKVTIL